VTKIKENQDCGKVSLFVIKTFYCASFVYNDWIFGDKFFSKLDECIKKKRTHHKTKPKQKKRRKHKTHLPLTSLPLLSCSLWMLMLLSSLSSSFVPENCCAHMSHHVKKI
jgi:hypothetical protein